MSYEPFLYVTENGGETWKRSDLEKKLDGNPFEVVVDEQLEFHPEMEDYVAVITNSRHVRLCCLNGMTRMCVLTCYFKHKTSGVCFVSSCFSLNLRLTTACEC